MPYSISFISEKDFKNHVLQTLSTYNDTLKSIDLSSFNSNIIDPIKLLFDKSVYNKSFEDIISLEIHRQRDKTNTNAIGYFHQNMFKYIANCIVPKQGWDVIYTNPATKKKIYVEMKNKHNTMNSAASQKTYMKMQNQVLQDSSSTCYLVEVIAPISRNIVWTCSVDGNRCEHKQIRRVSIDQFYKEVTGVNDAFLQICKQLPITISDLIRENSVETIQQDTVLQELAKINPDKLTALYILAFKSYEGFQTLCY